MAITSKKKHDPADRVRLAQGPFPCGHFGHVALPGPPAAASGQVGQTGARRPVATAALCHSDQGLDRGRPSARRLFADAEVAENHVQDVLDIDPAGEPPERPGGDAQLLGQQILAAGQLGRQRPPQGRQGVLQGPPVALAGHQRRLGAGQEAFGMAGEGAKSGSKPSPVVAERLNIDSLLVNLDSFLCVNRLINHIF